MPVYQSTPFKPPVQLLMPGEPSYVFGSYNDRVGPTKGYVISNSAVTTTATLQFGITAGNIPVVGELITVVGCANSANFNVARVAVASVTVNNAATGIVTVTYTIVTTTQGTLTDIGAVMVERVQTGEALTFVGTTAQASIPVTMSYNNPASEMGRSISASVQCTVAPAGGTLTATLQGANFDLDAEYQDVLTIQSAIADTKVYNAVTGQGTAATAGAVNLPNYRFWRIKLTPTAGLTATVVSKIED